MNHYQVLGVEMDADTTQIRKAYLQLARVNHPDFSHAGGEKMRQINVAWHELSDPDRRRAYDRYLRSQAAQGPSGVPKGARFSAAAPGEANTSRINRPSSAFTPYSSEDDDESWRFEPDEINPETVPSKVLLAAPAACFVAGVALLAVSAPTGIRVFTALGLILMVLSALLFVGAPVVALFKSQLVEQRSSKRRSAYARPRSGPGAGRGRSQ